MLIDCVMKGRPMTHSEIAELIALFDRGSAHTMKLTMGEFSLELSRAAQNPAPQGAVPVSSMSAAVPAMAVDPAPAQEALYVRAPLVGTFYAAPSPDQPPFVKVGDHVAQGQPLCLIEAMKMMCEVTAPCSCVIQEIIPENGSLLEYDAPIFRYQVV